MAKQKFRELTPYQARFVREYIQCNCAQKAIIAAGYKGRGPRQRGWYLLHSIPAVVEAIAAFRKAIVTEGKYGFEKAMDETERAINFAMEHKAPNAIPRLIELRMKMNGLLVERIDIHVQPIDISAALAEAKNRAAIAHEKECENVSILQAAPVAIQDMREPIEDAKEV